MMDDHGKSDGRVVPVSPPNKAVSAAAEVVEGRRPAKGNAASEPRAGLSAGQGVSSDLDRVRQVARKDRDARFTALLHHVTVERLEVAYRAIRPGAAPGIDGVTWRDYGQGLEENLRDLHARVQRGAYRARPSRRVFIPKPDGRLRPLGVAALEDKVVQRAVVEVLNAVYEEDFLGFSYGFRPGRSPHDALDALFVGITSGKVNWGKRRDKPAWRRDMRTSYIEGVATHSGLESCVGVPRGRSEALTEGDVGWVIEPRNNLFGVPTPSQWSEGNTVGRVSASCQRAPRGQRAWACVESPSARTGRSHGCPSAGGGRAGRSGKAKAVSPR